MLGRRGRWGRLLDVALNDTGRAILDHLARVEGCRIERAAHPSLGRRVHAIKVFQHLRFTQTYADVLSDDTRAGAAQFFLDEIYGPTDFTQRDAEFVRVVPALMRLFPSSIIETVLALTHLHALSEALDDAMALAIDEPASDWRAYQVAWRRIGRESDRHLQIELIESVGRAMCTHTRSRLLKHSLKAMRAPAHAAGLSALQQFLERGFSTFGALPDANAFIDLVVARESDFVARMFDPATQ